MSVTLSIARRLIKQITGDKRTLGLIFAAPVVMVLLLYIVLNSATAHPNLAVMGLPAVLEEALADNADLIPVETAVEGRDLVTRGKADAFLDYSITPPEVLIEGADPSVSSLVAVTLQKAQAVYLDGVISKTVIGSFFKKQTPSFSFMFGSTDSTFFDYLSPVLMGFIIFFLVFILAGVSFLRERTAGTLERLFATPLRKRNLVFGYLIGFGFFAALQTILIQTVMIYVIKAPLEGSFWDILLVNISLAAVALSLGMVLSAFARNEFQIFQFIPLVILPQIFFSGILDLREAHPVILFLSRILPLSWGSNALRDIMIRGKSLAVVFPDLLILWGFTAGFTLINIALLARYRRMQ